MAGSTIVTAFVVMLLTQTASRDWFQSTEQSLMDSVAIGDTKPWDAVMDARCIITTEEGEVMTKAEFLTGLHPLPAGLAGGIAVKELTVDEFDDTAIVRYLADEWETVFAQRLTTKYRMTDTFRRVSGAWKMVASHASVVTGNPPAQQVSTEDWPKLVGTYQLPPNGWTFYVVLRDGQLFGGRDRNALKRMIPMTPLAFVREDTLGEWLFVVGPDKKATGIVNLRKFEPLVWTRVGDK